MRLARHRELGCGAGAYLDALLQQNSGEIGMRLCGQPQAEAILRGQNVQFLFQGGEPCSD